MPPANRAPQAGARPRSPAQHVGALRAAFAALFDDGWETLEDLPPLKTHGVRRNAEEDHHHQRFARYFLRPVDQSLSRLRAWLQLLLCPADPRLYGSVAGARFRKQAVRQDQRGANCCRQELSNPNYVPKTIAIGTNTDPYQPIERELPHHAAILEVLSEFNHPVGIVTKSALVLRDLDILQPWPRKIW